MDYMKELAKVGREYLEQLEEERKLFIRTNNQQQVKLFEQQSTSPKKENYGNPE